MNLIYNPKREDIVSLLRTANLPADDLQNLDLSNFIGYENDAKLIGTIGLEQTGNYALLRSLVVSDPYRNHGIGTILVRKLEGHALSLEIERLYLLTTTAEKFFQSLGYSKAVRENVPKEIQNTNEFTTLCPSDSIVLYKSFRSE